jgi:hypothetical protein
MCIKKTVFNYNQARELGMSTEEDVKRCKALLVKRVSSRKPRYLRQNKKMKDSGGGKVRIYNFGIPAFRSMSGMVTCPNAGNCTTGCYARSGFYHMDSVKQAYERSLSLTLSDDFQAEMNKELARVLKNTQRVSQELMVRIHDSGDFYSLKYFQDWMELAFYWPDVQFYAYTKQVAMVKANLDDIPPNVKLIYSFGGKQDHLIDIENDRHSVVFRNRDELNHYHYADASGDDFVAVNNRCVGLVYHGSKKFDNTHWNKVQIA